MGRVGLRVLPGQCGAKPEQISHRADLGARWLLNLVTLTKAAALASPTPSQHPYAEVTKAQNSGSTIHRAVGINIFNAGKAAYFNSRSCQTQLHQQICHALVA